MTRFQPCSRRSRRWVPCWLVCVVVLLLATPVSGANMPHNDLSSLAAVSEAVVLARAVDGLRDVEVQPFVVLTSYRGPLAVEQRIDVQMWAIDFTDWTRPLGEPDDEVVMFLQRGKQGEWTVAASGMRIFIDGQTHRFVQGSNPGPYVPVAQRLDPFDIYGDPRAGGQLDRAAFLALLPTPVARAERFLATLEAPDSPTTRDQLLEFIGPAVGDDNHEPVTATRSYGFEDLIASSVLEELGERGDRTRLLEGLSRIRGGVIYGHLRNALQLLTQEMVAAALDPRRLPHHRVAALVFVREDIFAGDKFYPQLIELLAAKEPAIRAHAIAAGPHNEPAPAAWRDALLHWSQIETEMQVRYELIHAAHSGRFADRLKLADTPEAHATRRGRMIELVWTSVHRSWQLKSLHIEADGPEGLRVLGVEVDGNHRRSGTSQKMHAYALFDPPLAGRGFSQRAAALGLFDEVVVRKTSSTTSTAAFSGPRPRQNSRREATREKNHGLLADDSYELTVVAEFNHDQDTRELRLPVRPLGRGARLWEPTSGVLAPPMAETVENQPRVETPAGCRCGVGDTGWSSTTGILLSLCLLRRRRLVQP